MRGGVRLAACTAILAIAGCGGEAGKLTIRPIKAPVSAASKPVPARIAEAQAMLAMGNTALAIESYRKALRDDPNSVDAMAGLAGSYEQMGRFDLAQRYFESALAVDPANAMVLTAFAESLSRQGRTAEATALRSEITQRSAAAEQSETGAAGPAIVAELEPNLSHSRLQVGALADAPSVVPAFQSEAPSPAETADAPALDEQQMAGKAPEVGRSVTVALPPARPAPAIARARPEERGPRLERLSLAEVALVTGSRPQWRPTLVAETARQSTIRFVPLKQARQSMAGIRLLNAARIQGLAARTRSTLLGRGWRGIAIGNAADVRRHSLVLYPAASRATAKRLAAQFGIALAPRPTSSRVTVLLGRDAAAFAGARPAP